MAKAGSVRKCEDWFKKGRCSLPVEVECWRKSDCCWVEVNLAARTCCGYYTILNIGVSRSTPKTSMHLRNVNLSSGNKQTLVYQCIKVLRVSSLSTIFHLNHPKLNSHG